ncbi:MAG: DarT ssDNA thymidine ADP-ribosyltransferase family protein [Lachnospiraceae bacterium]
MGIETAKTGKLLYHLTKLDNLESIIKYGLLPREKVIEQKINFGDIANPEIISKRTELGLDAYTPFHFHPYSAFDVAVKHSYQEQDMIYLCFDRELARMNHFKILPLHPLSAEECILYDYDEGFQRIDWGTMMEKNRIDDYAKHVKMAECLTEKTIPINHFKCIYVPSEDVKEKTIYILNENGVDFPPPFINVMGVWFNE